MDRKENWSVFTALKYRSETTIVSSEDTHPTQFSLGQNYPNPFNPGTKMTYHLPAEGRVNIDIYDLRGRKVRNLVNKSQEMGRHTIYWDGKNNLGDNVASGIYFARMKVMNGQENQAFTSSRKLNLAR